MEELERTATARLVLTNDSASTWFNLKVGTETTVQRYDPALPSHRRGARLRPQLSEKRSAVFAESELSLAPRLTGRLGLRGEYSGLLRQANLAPRLALAWQLGQSQQVALAGGLFYQTPPTTCCACSRT